MKPRFIAIAAGLTGTLACWPRVATAQSEPEVAGCWVGTIASGPDQRRAVLELARSSDGVWTGQFHTLSSGVSSDSLAEIGIDGSAITFKVHDVSGEPSFVGELSEDGPSITGEITRQGATHPFALSRATSDDVRGQSLTGFWSGSLERNGIPLLRIVIKVAEAPCGQVVVTMDSPDQGAENLPITSLAVTADSLHFEMTYLNGVYAGAFDPDRSEIAGKWTQFGNTMALTLTRSETAPELRRPQEPVEPYPYDSDEVEYENEAAGVRLAGTLTLPRADGPFPAVLLISGSGAQDRNETLMGHRPFLVLADYLTRRGIAVLRVDDRGVGGSTGSVLDATLEDNAGDALAGVNYLKSRPEIDASKIGLIGHSEGGWVAPLAAVRSSDVAFIVLLAAPGVGGEDLLYLQEAAIAVAEGASAELVAANRAVAERIFGVLKEEQDDSIARRRVIEGVAERIAELPRVQRELLDSMYADTMKAVLRPQLDLMVSPWFRYLLTFEPRPTLLRVRVPVLALIGELDLQVPAGENLAALEEAFQTGASPDHTVLELSDLNHLFQTAQTGRIAEYAQIEETFAPKALEVIGDWILERTGRRH